jgi:hypothetical protein
MMKVENIEPVASPKNTKDPKFPTYTSVKSNSFFSSLIHAGNPPWSIFIDILNKNITK